MSIKNFEHILFVRRWYFKKNFAVSSDLIPIIRKILRKLGIKAKVEEFTLMPVLSMVSFCSKEDMNLFMISGHFNIIDDDLYEKPVLEYNPNS